MKLQQIILLGFALGACGQVNKDQEKQQQNVGGHVSSPVAVALEVSQASKEPTANDEPVDEAIKRMADQQLEDCQGRWVYLKKAPDAEGIGLHVRPNFMYELQFSDFGRATGNWTASGTLDVGLTLADEDGDFLLSECTAKAALLTKPDESDVQLIRASSDLFTEAKKRGLDFTENDGSAEE